MQFLVSKLVACCIPSKADAEQSEIKSSQVLPLLLQLTVDSDPSLYDYISVTLSDPYIVPAINHSYIGRIMLLNLCYLYFLAGIGTVS